MKFALTLLSLSCGVLLGAGATPTTTAAALYESPAGPTARNLVDPPVFTALAERHLVPARCSDAVFLRRVYLDTTGTLPTAAAARAFLLDPDLAGKRARLIDDLLASDAYARYWALRWADILRIKAEFPVNLWPNAAQAYHRWVYAALADNLPYDQFARALLTASGSNFRVGPVNFYRAIQNRRPDGIAAAVALAFMGTRIENWPAAQRDALAVFFSQVGYKPTNEWKEEHVFWDPLGTATLAGSTAPGRPAVAAIGTSPAAPTAHPFSPLTPVAVSAVFPDGTRVTLPPDRDPREIFTDWLLAPGNPWFARSLVNRQWAWLFGRGIVEEPDDFRPDNPPANPALLAALTDAFVGSHYDLKALTRLILNSATYQFSSLSPRVDAAGAANFAVYPLRRLDAEVLIDAINQITGTSDLYTSPIPEPFTFIPDDQTAVAIADGSITSPFLALFGRSARATGLMTERDHKPLPAQSLHLLNSTHIQRKLEQGPRLRALLDSGRSPKAIIEDLYLTILSRFPSADEARLALAYGQAPAGRPAARVAGKPAAAPARPAPGKRRDDWTDLAWALLNSSEFLYRH